MRPVPSIDVGREVNKAMSNNLEKGMVFLISLARSMQERRRFSCRQKNKKGHASTKSLSSDPGKLVKLFSSKMECIYLRIRRDFIQGC